MEDEVAKLLAEARAMKDLNSRPGRQPFMVNGKEVVRPAGSPPLQQRTFVRRGTSKRRAKALGMHMDELFHATEEDRQMMFQISRKGGRR